MIRPGNVRGGYREYPPSGEYRTTEVEGIGYDRGAYAGYGTGDEADNDGYLNVVVSRRVGGAQPTKVSRRVTVDPEFGHAISHP